MVNVIAVSRTDTASALSSNPRLIKFTTICYHNRASPSLRKGGKRRINIYTPVWPPISGRLALSHRPLSLPLSFSLPFSRSFEICRALKRKYEQNFAFRRYNPFKVNCANSCTLDSIFLTNDLNTNLPARAAKKHFYIVPYAFRECRNAEIIFDIRKTKNVKRRKLSIGM